MTKHTDGEWEIQPSKIPSLGTPGDTAIRVTGGGMLAETWGWGPSPEGKTYHDALANAQHIVTLHNATLPGGSIVRLLEAALRTTHAVRSVSKDRCFWCGDLDETDPNYHTPTCFIPRLNLTTAAVEHDLQGDEHD